ncbi:MAG: hypothetical protein BWY99_00762 [Synergistetes bacterium ADurb.BinA166]|nr:MAG: hypothetical protein BWY99_00762 [Synergistetes bacterium ADurb.BinA166]
MPVQRPTIWAISSSVTSSRSSLDWPSSSPFSLSLSSASSCGRVPCFSSAALFRSYSRSALSISRPMDSMRCRSSRTALISFFSASYWARIPACSSRASCSSLRRDFSLSPLAASFSLTRAASSISSCITLLETASSSAGRESISVRIIAHASSTRSMALSGRNRSVM